MHIDKLSLSYRCHSSIGNSLELDIMIEEVLRTFCEETFAISASFYLEEEDKAFVHVGKKTPYEIKKMLDGIKNEIIIKDVDSIFNVILYPLNKGIMLFYYDKSISLEFIVSMYESFRKKLNISIDSCLNVQQLKDKNRALEDLSANLQQKVDESVALNRKKDKQLFEQLKMSQMGELIGNIAHQWRQPLNVISTATSGMKLKKELNILTDESFFDYSKSILNNVQFLSQTIDEFRDYIKDSHKEKEIIIQERVQMALSMIESSAKMNNIQIVAGYIEKEPILFKLIIGELLQVLISIFKNAQEALAKVKEQERIIKYEIRNTDGSVKITIEDNAGGIDMDIIDKIFNPYFTTKHQSRGTGIGLYASYDIITNHLNGKLYVENTPNGAKFSIELPVYVDYII